MLLIGESSMSNAHLVNGAVVNVRARVRLIFIFFDDCICGVFITSLRNRCQCSSKGGARFFLLFLMMIEFDKVVSDIYCFRWKI